MIKKWACPYDGYFGTLMSQINAATQEQQNYKLLTNSLISEYEGIGAKSYFLLNEPFAYNQNQIGFLLFTPEQYEKATHGYPCKALFVDWGVREELTLDLLAELPMVTFDSNLAHEELTPLHIAHRNFSPPAIRCRIEGSYPIPRAQVIYSD